MTQDRTRRQWLRTIGIGGVATLATPLAGCTGAGGSTPTPRPEDDGGDGGGGDGDGSDGSGGGQWTETSTVDMTDDLTFAPERAQVSAGTTVTWENVGSIGHTVTAYEDEIPEGAAYFASGGFDSEEAAREGYPSKGNIQGGDSYEHTFETAGTYKYLCVPHEMNGMVGYIKVV